MHQNPHLSLAGIGTGVPSLREQSPLSVFRSMLDSQSESRSQVGEQERYTIGDPQAAEQLAAVLSHLGRQLTEGRASTSHVATRIREALLRLGAAQTKLPEAVRDLRQLLADVTSPSVSMTLEDVSRTVTSILERTLASHP